MLFTPFKIQDLSLKNRIVMPPMDMFSAKDGFINDFHLLHYEVRALGGVGLIIVESTAVSKDARISSGCLGLYEDAQIKAHEDLVKRCHKHGAKLALQLNHSGRKNSQGFCVGPSEIRFSNDYKTPQALSLKDIEKIKLDFLKAGQRALKAGYDAVQIHAAHGYLLNSFLCPLSNKREDEYGGSFEKRTALLCEIISLFKSEIPLPLLVRISATHWEEGGWELKDSLKLAQKLKDLGVGLLDVSAGGNLANPSLMPTPVPLYQCEYSKVLKKSGLDTICVGLISTGAQGKALLLGGVADLIAYGRALLRNPNLPQAMAFELGKKEEILNAYARGFI